MQIEANLAKKRAKRQSLTSIKKKSKDEEEKTDGDTKKAAEDAAAKADEEKKEPKEEKKEEGKEEAKEEKTSDKKSDKKTGKKEESEKKEETIAEAKARRLKEIAKMKVEDLIAKHKELDAHLKEQYATLEKILIDMNIKANFNPEIKRELEWAAGQIKLVLEATP